MTRHKEPVYGGPACNARRPALRVLSDSQALRIPALNYNRWLGTQAVAAPSAAVQHCLQSMQVTGQMLQILPGLTC
jgi:hypothetical protein